MEVTLVHHTPIQIVIDSIRTCYDSNEKSDSKESSIGTADLRLLTMVINNGHTSTLEHACFHFSIKEISRLCLQELSRHRIASPSVKSTRYTLKELKKESPFVIYENIVNPPIFDMERASKYVKLTGTELVDQVTVIHLDNVRDLIAMNEFSIDLIKYALPEAYLTNERLTINLRSLINFLELRKSHRAHFEIRNLAELMLNSLPEIYKTLVKAALGELKVPS